MVGSDEKAILHDASSFEEIRSFDGVGQFWAVAFSFNSTILTISGHEEKAIVFDVESGQEIQSIQRNYYVLALAISSYNCHIVVADKEAAVYELSSGKLVHAFKIRAMSVAFHSANDCIAIGGRHGDDEVFKVADA